MKKINSEITYQKFIYLSTILVLVFVTLLSIGYSVFTQSLEIEGNGIVRADAEVRFTENSIKGFTSDGTEKASSKYTTNTITNHIELPNCDSTASYNVSIKNNTDSLVQIKSLIKDVWNNDSIGYEIIGFDLDNERISPNSEKTFELLFKKVNCSSDNNVLDSVLKLELADKVDINYSNNILAYSDESNPKLAFVGDTVTARFTGVDDTKIGVKINGKSLTNGMSYTYANGEVSTLTVSNGVATLTNVNDNVTFSVINIVSIYLGGKTDYYKASTYNATILDIEFVDYINLDNADVSWDITVDKNGLAYAWIEGTKLYIGSELEMMAPNLSYAFNNLNQVKTLKFNDKLNTSETTTMEGMFAKLRKLESIDVSNFDTSNVEKMNAMFDSVSTITSLDISNFDTSKVTTMQNMFISLSKAQSINFGNIDTSNVTTMQGMFYGCTNILSLDLSKFRTPKLKTITNMFYGCTKITSIDLSSFDTTLVDGYAGMFNTCTALKEVNLSSFNGTRSTSMSNMFKGCKNLTTLDLSSFKTATVKIMDGAFSGCTNLKTIYVSDTWDMSGVQAGKGVGTFTGCTNLVGAVPFDPNNTSYDYATTDYYLTLKN